MIELIFIFIGTVIGFYSTTHLLFTVHRASVTRGELDITAMTIIASLGWAVMACGFAI